MHAVNSKVIYLVGVVQMLWGGYQTIHEESRSLLRFGKTLPLQLLIRKMIVW